MILNDFPTDSAEFLRGAPIAIVREAQRDLRPLDVWDWGDFDPGDIDEENELDAEEFDDLSF